MDKRKLLRYGTLAFFPLFFACSKSNEEDLKNHSNIICDTTNISFIADIAPILEANCNFCHNSISSGLTNTNTYNGVKILADKGNLLGAITHSPSYRPMPLGGQKLGECDINKISAWIKADSPNN